MHYLAWLITGLAAGWLVGFLMRGRGYGLLGDLLLGVSGGFIGGRIFHEVRGGPELAGWPGHLMAAVFGAWTLAIVWRVVRRALVGEAR